MTNFEAIGVLKDKFPKSKEYDCNGCVFLTVDEGKDPCRMCRRNCKDYFRRAKKNAD